MAMLFVTLFGCGRSVDPNLYAKFERAQQAFDRADSPEQFMRAAALYQEILDAGVVSGAVLYNQGNAFMRAGERGRAVACYRQAQRYRPRDPYLEANLRNALGGNVAESRKPLVEYLLFWQDWISYSNKFSLSTLCALLTFCLAVVSLYRWPTALRRVAGVALCLTLVLAVSAVYDWYRFTHIKHGVVAVEEVVARKGDGESYQPAFTDPLGAGTEFVVLEQRNNWVRVRLDGAEDGWVPRADVVVY